MYLGYKEYNSSLNKNVFVVCLQGTQEDILRVKKTSSYFNNDKFERLTCNQIKRLHIDAIDKSGKIIKLKEDFE